MPDMIDQAISTPGEPLRQTVFETSDLAGLTDDSRFTKITDFAASLCKAPIALISLVETDCQWFPARTGLATRETPRSSSFCAHAMLGTDIMVVPNALSDARFAKNPLVLGEPSSIATRSLP